MSAPHEPKPSEVAHFDQAYAEASERLDELVAIHRDLLADGEEVREVRIAGFAQYLFTEADASYLAQVLAVAVTRLADLALIPREDTP